MASRELLREGAWHVVGEPGREGWALRGPAGTRNWSGLGMVLSKGRQRAAVSPQLIWEGAGQQEGLRVRKLGPNHEATLALKDVTALILC